MFEHGENPRRRNRPEGEVWSSGWDAECMVDSVGAPMGCAPIAHALWGSIMNYNPKDPKWVRVERGVDSAD